MKSFETIARKLKPQHFDPVQPGVTIPFKRHKVFFHSGDFGDIIYCLPTIRALGGGRLVIGPANRWKTRLKMTLEHMELLRPLLELQPYLTGVEFMEAPPDDTDLDLNQFREYLITEHERIQRGERRLNLAEAHLYTFKINLEECQHQWLSIDYAQPVPDRPVLLHRSARWRNTSFPWQEIMKRHSHHALFVGLESEHADFVNDFGAIPYRPTANFLELARLIAGCRLYIGNQSLPYAICEGLKHNSVLEVWPEGPNCLFRRKNAIYGESSIVYIPKVREKQMNTKVEHCPFCGADAAGAPTFRAKNDIVQCPGCSLVYLRTRPDEDTTMLYYQQYADDHSHMRLPKNFDDIRSSGLRRDYFMQELLTYIKPPGSLLDIGCGWGAFLANAREKGFTPYGVDVCHKAANFASTVLGIPTVCDQLEDCQFTECMFDVVVVIHTLEHLTHLADSLQRIHKILKLGGVLAGIVPNIDSYCSNTLKERWQWLDENTHYVHFKPDTLKAVLQKHGFELLHVYTHTGDYDDPELRRLLGQRDGKDPNSEDVNNAIKELWANGQGEEIRFFAKVCELPS